MKSRRIIITAVIVLGICFFGMACLGLWIPGIEVVFYLIIGWARYLGRVGPQIRVRWDLAGSTLVYAAALVVGSQLFLRWLYREIRRPSTGDSNASPPRAWQWRWTFSGFALILLMFVSGIAAIGVVHQTTWLIRSPEPLYRRGGERANRMKCANNMKQIGYAIAIHANGHAGNLPDDLTSLVRDRDAGLTGFVLLCPASDIDVNGDFGDRLTAGQVDPGHYIYLGKGLVEPIDPQRALVVERPKNHNCEGMNVLFGDLHVEWLDAEAAERVLNEIRALQDAPATTQSGSLPGTNPTRNLP